MMKPVSLQRERIKRAVAKMPPEINKQALFDGLEKCTDEELGTPRVCTWGEEVSRQNEKAAHETALDFLQAYGHLPSWEREPYMQETRELVRSCSRKSLSRLYGDHIPAELGEVWGAIFDLMAENTALAFQSRFYDLYLKMKASPGKGGAA